MKLEPVSVRLADIGGQAAVDDKMWASVEVALKDVDVDHTYVATLKLLVPKRLDVTLRELQEAARETAIYLLREAADLLERETIEALEQQEADRDAAEASRLRAAFSEVSAKPEGS